MPRPAPAAIPAIPPRPAVAPGRIDADQVGGTVARPPAPAASAAGLSRAARPAAAAETAVRHTLDSYRDAYGRLNVAATADVWPSVDRRALARAFEALESQGLNFERCAISVAESRATAQCHGTLRFVPRVGGSAPASTRQQWVFELHKLGADWKIADVSASQAPRP